MPLRNESDLVALVFQFGERFILYYVTHLLLSIFNMYTPEELAAEDGRRDKTGTELLNKKRLIEIMDRAYDDLKKTNNIVLNLRGLTPSYDAYKHLLAQPDIKALVREAEKGRIKNYDRAIQLDHIFERRPTHESSFTDEWPSSTVTAF